MYKEKGAINDGFYKKEEYGMVKQNVITFDDLKKSKETVRKSGGRGFLENLYKMGILDKDSFHHFINIERARSDRNNVAFSLILFDFTKIEDKDLLKYFIKELYKRVRKVDVFGLFERNIVGILLHATKIEGAWKFAIDIENRIYTKQIFPSFSIFSYPDHWHNIYNDKSREENKLDFHRTEPDSSNSKVMHLRSYLNKPQSYCEHAEKFSRYIKEKMSSIFVKNMPFWKRLFDIIASAVFIILFSPVFLYVALFIKIVSTGSIFFKQKRVGFKGNVFTFLKFRTMKTNNNVASHKSHLKDLINSDKPMQKLDSKEDPRIIPGGTFLRKSSIDELPQLFNILKGEMSFVGPRPCILYEANEYSQWHHGRFDVVPGLTGLWQVSGKNKLTFKQMIRLDIKYREKMSLWNDIKIIFLTIPTVLGILVRKN